LPSRSTATGWPPASEASCAPTTGQRGIRSSPVRRSAADHDQWVVADERRCPEQPSERGEQARQLGAEQILGDSAAITRRLELEHRVERIVVAAAWCHEIDERRDRMGARPRGERPDQPPEQVDAFGEVEIAPPELAQELDDNRVIVIVADLRPRSQREHHQVAHEAAHHLARLAAGLVGVARAGERGHRLGERLRGIREPRVVNARIELRQLDRRFGEP
jgi:hypothetical protein